MARGMFRTVESFAWTMVVLAALMMALFYILHLLSGAPAVGGAASFVANRASGSAYGY